MDAIEWSAFKTMGREIGWWKAIRLGLALRKKVKAGAPFQSLPPAKDEAEQLSRNQIGPALVLYQEAQRFFTQKEAYDLTAAVASTAAIVFLGQMIGPLTQKELSSLNDSERRAFVEERGKKFFNATMRWDKVETTDVHFTVTRCTFPTLCEAVGLAELAPIFCKGDAIFFGQVEKNVELNRPKTIAGGDSECIFQLRWIPEEAEDSATERS
jgi:hypothetical protein